MCLGNLRATEEMSSLFIPNSRNCSCVISNTAACFTVLPSRCSRFFQAEDFGLQGKFISVLAPHLMETSPQSNSVQVFCLI